MTAPRRITLAMLMATTGLGPIQVRRDVRAGKLPGEMRGRQYVCPPGEYDAWYRGEWTPRTSPHTEPVTLLRHRNVG